MDNQKTGLLEESPGVTSSKRFFGAALISAGGLLLTAIGVVAIFQKVADPETALAAGTTLVATGAALLGIGVLEGLGNRIGGPRE
jgi:hypothetical protein